MEPNPLTRTQTILKSLVMASGESIIEIYRVPLSVDFLPSFKIVVAAEASIKDLRLFYELSPTFDPANLPDIRITDSRQAVIDKTIDAHWSGARKQLNLYLKNRDTDWYLMGQAALVKIPDGLPYQLIELIEKFTFKNTIELSGGAAIGVSITDAGKGGIAANDVFNISGSVVEKFTLQDSISSTYSPTSVVATASAVILLAANPNRKGASIYNNSSANLYINYAATVNITTNYAVMLNAKGYFELPYSYTGVISGIWSAANGNAQIIEFV